MLLADKHDYKQSYEAENIATNTTDQKQYVVS